MEDEYSKAYQELTADDAKPEVKDVDPLEDPKPKKTPQKEAAEAEAVTEAQAFADAWNEAA